MKEKNVLNKYYVLWSSQGLSHLGSSATAFALTLWLYEKTGLALSTALLTICTYAPYVLMSIFAGALIDKFDKKKTMLICDLLAALSTICVLILYKTNNLEPWHLYLINVFSGLMNTIQQPSSEVALTLLVPKEYYQKTSALNNLSRSIVSILNPLIATALYGLRGLDFVIAFDLTTFVIAFIALLFFIDLPAFTPNKNESVIKLAKEGLAFLKKTPLVFTLILFMSGVNLVASAFDAALPGYIIPNPKGGSEVLGIVTSCAGIAMVIGSLIVAKLPKPKDRIKVVYITMLLSLTIENFVMSLTRQPIIWCMAQFIGWFLVPIMSTNLEVVLRNSIPVELQGRVYACRNTFQYFTIPIGLFLGGVLVDKVCEPFMANNINSKLLTFLFGVGKGSGAGLVIFLLGVSGGIICLLGGIRLKKYHYIEEQ